LRNSIVHGTSESVKKSTLENYLAVFGSLAEHLDRKLQRQVSATPEELMEAIWVAAEMRAGGAYAHSAVSLVAMDEATDRAPSG
jgi:hypothetical protein